MANGKMAYTGCVEFAFDCANDEEAKAILRATKQAVLDKVNEMEPDSEVDTTMVVLEQIPESAAEEVRVIVDEV